MSGTTPFRQNRSFATMQKVWLLCLSCLLASNSLAATNETTPKAKTATAKTILNNSSKQAKIPVFPKTQKGARQAFKQKYYSTALKILIALEEKHAGKIEFDYLLGRTAIEVKNYDLAIAALTRVLTIDPSFAAARLEIARANYSKGVAKLSRGPFEQARSEFKLVLQQDPPEEIRQSIQQYLEYIDKYLKVREAESYVFVELGAGYDSNVNSTSDYPYFSYYDSFNGRQETYKLGQYTEQKESTFGQTRIGTGMTLPIFSNNFEIFGGLMAGGKSYSSNHDYDHIWSQIHFGMHHYGSSDKKTIQIKSKSTDVYSNKNKQENYHEENQFRMQWDKRANKTNALSLWLLGGDSSYHVRGTEVYSVSYNRQGIEWTHLIEGKRKSSFQLMLMNGRDNPQECRNNSDPCPESYTRDVAGVRVAWSNNIFNTSRFYTSLFYQYSEYDREFFYQRRLDRRSELFMGINTKLGNYWHLRPEVHYIHNHSSLDLYEFERSVASLTLRLEF